MAASHDTVREVLKVVDRHVKDKAIVRAILEDLLTVAGNQSFRDTIKRMAAERESC